MHGENRIENIDALRGIACILVVLHHFSSSTIPEVELNYLHDFFKYGSNGVYTFFVISGFILPYSMKRANYKIKNFFNFLKRRSIRILPAYYITFIPLIVLQCVAFLFNADFIQGLATPNIKTLLINLGLIDFLIEDYWFNPVGWTLQVEMQFYILIGLFLPLLINYRWIRLIALGLLYLLSFKVSIPITNNILFFAVGFLLFLFKDKKAHLLELLGLFVISSICIIYFRKDGISEFVAMLLPFIVIFFNLNIGNKAILKLGKISYSLYLVHVVFMIFADLSLKKLGLLDFQNSDIGKIFILVAYTIASIIIANYFYNKIEVKFIKLSKNKAN